jgi:hypothetical protein
MSTSSVNLSGTPSASVASVSMVRSGVTFEQAPMGVGHDQIAVRVKHHAERPTGGVHNRLGLAAGDWNANDLPVRESRVEVAGGVEGHVLRAPREPFNQPAVRDEIAVHGIRPDRLGRRRWVPPHRIDRHRPQNEV